MKSTETTTKTRGRKKKPDEVEIVTLRIQPEHRDALAKIADDYQTSISSLIRLSIVRLLSHVAATGTLPVPQKLSPFLNDTSDET